MKALKRFVSLDDCFKDGVKKMVPYLADRNDFEVEYRKDICPQCEGEEGAAIYYQLHGETDWIPVGNTYKCSSCRDKDAFNVYQNQSIADLKQAINKRLSDEYFHVPEDLREAGFQNYKKTNKVTSNASTAASVFVKDFLKGDKYNLLIMGNPGTGKTHLCVAIARNIQSHGYSVGIVTTGKLLTKIKATYNKGSSKTEEEILEDVKKFDLLILDDVGSEAIGGNDDWRKSMIFEVINSRIGKPTIYTSNLTDTDLPVAVGSRVFSRLYNNTKFIDLFTEDYRKNLKRA